MAEHLQHEEQCERHSEILNVGAVGAAYKDSTIYGDATVEEQQSCIAPWIAVQSQQQVTQLYHSVYRRPVRFHRHWHFLVYT